MDNIVSKYHPLKSSYFEEGGMVLIDKPLGWTSFDVVNKLRYAIRRHLEVKKYKVGHAGTLDPLATGLLIVCFGKYTKLIDQVMATEKGYIADITLGATTPSYDMETLPDTYYPIPKIDQVTLQLLIKEFTGEIEQLPPMFSAVKVKGVPLYRLARKGKEIKRKLRNVVISSLEVQLASRNKLSAIIQCSKGTYIRSLAHDMGKFLKTGGYLSALRRTAIGQYNVEEAITIDEFIKQLETLKLPTK